MVVAARAVDRQPQEAPSGRGNEIVQILVPPLRVVLLAKGHPRAGAQEAGRNQGFLGLPFELVAGDLLLQERVVGFVLIERADHVVAIAPGVGAVVVLLEAARIGVPGDIQPVAAPSLAVVRRGEQRVNQSLPRARGVVREKRGGLQQGSAAARSDRDTRGGPT